MRLPLILGMAVGGLAAGAGCGPIEYMNQVGGRATSAVAAARAVQAGRHAPYELTAAEQYLHQARVEAAYSFYQTSIEFGHKAEEMANKAQALAVQRRAAPVAPPVALPAQSAPPLEAAGSPGASPGAPAPPAVPRPPR